MKPQKAFVYHLRFGKSMTVCEEVSSHGCIADVLAIDRQGTICEYEFKASSNDLKNAELKKAKYKEHYEWIMKGPYRRSYKIHGQKIPNPEKFYYVVPEALWEKEQEYLKSGSWGVIAYTEVGNFLGYHWWTVKPCRKNKVNVQNKQKVKSNIARRATSAYANIVGAYCVWKSYAGIVTSRCGHNAGTDEIVKAKIEDGYKYCPCCRRSIKIVSETRNPRSPRSR